MSAVDNLYNEMANRLIRIKGTGDPNDDPSLDPYAIGTEYRQTDEDPYIVWGKFASGSDGWDLVFDLPPTNARYVDANSTETYENGSEFYPYKSMLTALEEWGRPVDLDDALTTKFLIVNSGTYTDALTIYASRRINIKINGVVIINSITMEIDGNNDFAAGSVLVIDETSAIFLKVLSAAAILSSLTFNEINPSTNTISATLSFKSLMCSQISCSVTNPVFANLEKCRITNVTGSIRFDVIKTTILRGTWSIISASIYNSGVDSENYPVLWGVSITASESLQLRETWNPSGLTLTTPDLQIDRFSYDAGMEDGSLTIGTPGSVTMIDPPKVGSEFYVDAHYTGDYSNGSKEYPFTTIQAPLDVLGVPVDLADELQDYRIIINGDTGILNYAEDLVIPANRKVVLEADGWVQTTSITVDIDGNTQFSDYSFLGIISRYALDSSNNIISQLFCGNFTANVINPTTHAFYISLVSARFGGTIDVSQVTGTTNITAINSNLSGYFTGPNAIITFRDSSLFLLGTTTIKRLTMSESRSSYFCSDLIISGKAGFYDSIDFYDGYGPMALTVGEEITADYDAYRELIEGPVTISTPSFIVEAPPIPRDGEFYVNVNYTGDYSNGSEEFPFATPALARAADADAIIKLSGYIENVDVDTGTETIDEFPDTVGNNAEWSVVISKGANVEKLTATTVWDAGTDAISALTTDTTATIGTIDITLSCDLVADQVRLKATATSDDWSVKIIERTIS